VGAGLLTGHLCAVSAEENLDFFHPVLVRRAVIERETELLLSYERGREGREVVAAPGIAWPLLPRWHIELEVPAIFREPRNEPSEGGPGDVLVETKVQIFKSEEHQALLAVGLGLGFPSGSSERGLGGQTTVTPFVSAGVKLASIELQGDIGYSQDVTGLRRSESLTAGIAAGGAMTPWVIPFLELTFIDEFRGNDIRMRNRLQMYLTPAVNIRSGPATVVLGVQLPLSDAKTFDYGIRLSVFFEL